MYSKHRESINTVWFQTVFLTTKDTKVTKVFTVKPFRYLAAVLPVNSVHLQIFGGHRLMCCSFVTFVPFVVKVVIEPGRYHRQVV